MQHVPILRAGRPYRSLNRTELPHVATGASVAQVSQANPGLISRDLRDAGGNQDALRGLPVRELLEMCKRAAALFTDGELPLDPLTGTTQSPEDYVRALSATTGMPQALCRANMQKIRFVLDEMERVLAGLTRGVDLEVLDSGWVEQGGRTVSYLCQSESLGAVLPGNSPGVHSLWLPAVALKVPLVLKPGALEPWTPMRIAQALLAAGVPEPAVSVYPTDHGGAAQILLHCKRSMLFGDASTIGAWANDGRIQLHGPGWSKVLFGDDIAPRWDSHIDLLVSSIAENGGRSCVNASGVWTPAHGRELAEALARRLAAIEALPLDDDRSALAAFPNPKVAQAFSDLIEQHLAIPGAVDLTTELRGGPRVVTRDGCTFVLPTVIWCEDPGHPLASCEFLFPFVSVVQTPVETMVERIGPTLVATVLSDDPVFRNDLMRAPHVDRLNLGSIPTCRVSWDQPHEGNLFEHLYRQRAFQSGSAA